MKKHLSQMMRLTGAKATGGLATTLGIMAVHSQASAAKFTGTDRADDITGSPWDEDDLIRLLDGNDTAYGRGGQDRIYGGNGKDEIYGGKRGDRLFGGNDDDTLDGGDGDDTLTYLNATENVTVNLHVGKASNDVQLTSIENVIGSNFDDYFVSSDAANEFAGQDGADTLSYAYSDAAVTVNAFTGKVSGGFADGDIIDSVERFIGSDHDDHFISTDGVVNPITDSRYASFNGKAGSDTVSYAYSNESVHANLDSGVVLTDTGSKEKLIQIENAIGTSQDDIFVASAAANTLDGADGYSDMVSYEIAEETVFIDLLNGAAFGEYADGDRFLNIESVRGGAGDDTLSGDGAANVLQGGDGNDTLIGRSGDDTLIGNAGDDVLMGGDGDDRLDGQNGADLMTGGAGANKFVLDFAEAGGANVDDDGNDVITDFTVADGDKLVVDTTNGDETTLSAFGISILANADDATDTDIVHNLSVIATLVDVDHTNITDDNFASYFEVI